MASIYVAYAQEVLLSKDNFGIIFSEEIDVFSEPNTSSRVLFSLHEGTKVNVVDEFRDYQKIELTNGSTGWVNPGSVKLLGYK
jgi:SH3-like domain-containing protein